MACNVAGAAKELRFKYYFISMNLNVNWHMKQVLTTIIAEQW